MAISESRPKMSRLAVVALAAGLVALVAPYSFPMLVIWAGSLAVPAAYLTGSGLAFLPPVVAITCGHLALGRLGKAGSTARALAWAGLVMGYVGLLQLIAFEVVFWLIALYYPVAY